MHDPSDADSATPAKPSSAAANDVDDASPPKTPVTFDPYAYGRADGIGRWGATAHIIRTSVGSGLLVMPYAMKNLGYVTGALLMVSVSALYFHTINVLLATEYRLCVLLGRKRFTYIGLTDAIVERAPFPLNRCRRLVRALMYTFYSLPVCNAAILIVMSTGVQQMARYAGVELRSVGCVATVLLVPLTVCCMLNGLLKLLVPYSASTNTFALVMAFVLIGCGLYNRRDARADRFTARPFGDADALPQSVALFVQTLRCTGIIVPLKNDMRRPGELAGVCGAVNVSGAILTLFYTCFGCLAYALYGVDTRDNILENMPTATLVPFVIHTLYTAEMLVAFIVSFYVYHQNVWSTRLEERLADSRYKAVVDYGIRLAIIALAYGMAVGVPHLGLIAAISGTAGIVVEVALPSVLELLFELSLKRKRCGVIFKDACIVAFSAMLVTTSLKCFVDEMVELYST